MRAGRNERNRMKKIGEWVARIVLFAVLAYAGLLKFNRPDAAADFLDSLLQVHSTTLVRAIGVAEVMIALVIISGVASLWTGRIVVALFTMFAVTHALAASGGGDTPACGCLGSSELTDRIPSWGWISGNMALAFLGGMIAWSASPDQPPQQVDEIISDATDNEVTHG